MMKIFFRVVKIPPLIVTSKGFSLIELMVVVAILAILTSIAIPNFLGLKKSGKVLEAKTGLIDFYRLQQSFFIENGFYSAKISDIGFDHKSQHYSFGFKTDYINYKDQQDREVDIDPLIGKSCGVNTVVHTFRVVAVSKDNELTNYTISEKNCLQELKAKSKECSQVRSQKCLN